MNDKKPAYLSIALIILFFLNPVLASNSGKSATTKITTMNVAWYGSTKFPPMNDDEREGLLEDFFKTDLLSSDIILFQEITKPEQFELLLDSKYDCFTYNDRGRAHQYVLTCFDKLKFDSINTSDELFDDSRTIHISEPKERLRDVMYLSLKHKSTGYVIHTFNLHFKAGDDESALRLVQGERLLDQIKKLNIKQQETILIAGDFNSYSPLTSNKTANEFEAFLDLSEEKGFDFYTVKNLNTTLAFKQKSFDHILVDSNKDVLDYSVHPVCDKTIKPNSLIEDFMFFKDNISDHCPVSVILN